MFNPEDFGFTPLNAKKASCHRKDYCYLSVRKENAGRHSEKLVLVLDSETTDMCKAMFGERVSVATNDEGKIVLYKGEMRALSVSKTSLKRCTISMDVECEKIKGIIGNFSTYRYDAKVYGLGEAVLLTPKEKVE